MLLCVWFHHDVLVNELGVSPSDGNNLDEMEESRFYCLSRAHSRLIVSFWGLRYFFFSPRQHSDWCDIDILAKWSEYETEGE
jgi:hypothetical protein